jgi:gliding motility-associated-like protein
MFFQRLFFIIVFLFLSNSLFATTFVVTSSADAGPGTLRQALLDAAANGTVQIDSIHFNLPGNTQAAITITVQTQLPDVTANVIIDGTTQPGPSLGVSNAKVIIRPAIPAQNLNAFNVSNLVGPTDAVEFYGLYIEGFAPNQTGNGTAIVTTADCALVVGAPGQGNVICGNYGAVLSFLQNAKIQSNFIGIEPDGVTANVNTLVLYSSEDYNNLVVGGANPTDGNVILSGNNGALGFGGVSTVQIIKSATIQNNYFGTDYKAATAIATSIIPFIQVNDPYSTLNITGNVFSASEPAIAALNQATLIVKGNYFGTDKTQTYSLGSGAEAIEENTGINATIGGTLATDQNVFTNYQNPILAVNNSVTNVIENSFYCNNIVQLADPSGTNYIRIISLLNNSASGDAPPGATVQLYYTTPTTTCTTCNPNTWFATVTANASGVWQYTGNILHNVLASSTVANNTYGFQPFTIGKNEVTVTNYDCHHEGSLKITEPRQGNFQFIWKDSKGNVIGTAQEVDNLQPGTYSLEINEGGTCPSETGQFTIINLLPHVFSQTVQLNCTDTTGFFTAFPSTGPGITVANYYWKDANGNLLSDSSSIKNLPAGNYYLYITDSNGCNSDTALCKVLPALATPIINYSNATITDANCNLPDGSITGITLSNAGSANYGWITPNGTILNYEKLNLTNAPPGQYYFFVDYDFNCPEIKSKVFTINSKNGVTLNDSLVSITPSTCSNSNGSIKGIVTTGANTYKWFDSKNNVVDSTVNLVNALAGTYYLVASNAYCSQQSKVYTITNTPAFNNFQSTYVSNNASCNQSNGSIVVTFNSSPAPTAYRWTTAAGVTLVSNTGLYNVEAGTYQLYVTDSNGCESFYKNYTINSTPPIQIVQGSAQVTNDQCDHNIGSIQNITVTGGVLPYTYSWLNPSLQLISDSLNLTGIGPGIYTLQVKDATSCGLASQDYTIISETAFVPPPVANNIQICSPGPALLTVNNPQAGYGYRLYDTETSTVIKDDQTSGVFKINVTSPGSVYVSQYTGNCESARVEVKIMIGSSSLSIPNIFTPNNDGINDLWVIKGIEDYPHALVQVFNRYGQKVFESRGYSSPFDGKIGGAELPTGVYYYIINLNSNCSLLSGSLTILR